MDDEEEHRLRRISIESELALLLCMKKKYEQKFNDDTKDLIIDTTHWLYNILYSVKSNPLEKDNPPPKDNPKNKKMFKKLSLIIHPDKCKKKWAIKMWHTLTNAYESDDFLFIQEIDVYWETHHNFTNFQSSYDNTKTIKKLKASSWYQWHFNEFGFREMFVSYQSAHDKLLAENEKLKQDIYKMKNI